MSPATAGSQKSKALLIQHPLAPVTLVQAERDSMMKAKHEQRLGRVLFVATILARFDDVDLNQAPAAVRAHYMNSARIGMTAAQKVSW